MQDTSNRLKVIPLAIACLLYGFSPNTIATPVTYGNITLDAEYSLNGGSTVNAMANPPSYIYSNSSGADMYLYTNDGANGIFFHTYGFAGTSTYFGARASGEGYFDGTTRSTYSNTFTNTSTVAQLFNFAFHVDDGGLAITGSGNAFATLALSIKKDGVVIARDETTLSQTGTSQTCATNDFGTSSLKGYTGCSSNVFTGGSAGNFSVDMGLIGAGERFTLDYDIIATVSGNLSNGTGTREVCDGGGYGGEVTMMVASLTDDSYGGGGGGLTCHEETYTVPGSAISRSGDPFESPIFDEYGTLISAPPSAVFASNFSDPNAVPEPGSLALLGLALAGLASTRRKRKR